MSVALLRRIRARRNFVLDGKDPDSPRLDEAQEAPVRTRKRTVSERGAAWAMLAHHLQTCTDDAINTNCICGYLRLRGLERELEENPRRLNALLGDRRFLLVERLVDSLDTGWGDLRYAKEQVADIEAGKRLAFEEPEEPIVVRPTRR